MIVSFGSPLVLAWLVFMYYRFVDGWLRSLSSTNCGLVGMGAGLTVVAVVALLKWWTRGRNQSAAHEAMPEKEPVEVLPGADTNREDLVQASQVQRNDAGEDEPSLEWSSLLSSVHDDSASDGSHSNSANSWHFSSDDGNGHSECGDDRAHSLGGSCRDVEGDDAYVISVDSDPNDDEDSFQFFAIESNGDAVDHGSLESDGRSVVYDSREVSDTESDYSDTKIDGAAYLMLVP